MLNGFRSVRLFFPLPLLHAYGRANYCTKNTTIEKIKAIRGMHDLLPEDFAKKKWVIDKGRQAADRFGFEQIETPVVEDLGLFVRAIGTDSDVVSKEIFSWEQSKQKVALRPEGTSGVIRSMINPSPIIYSPRDIKQQGIPQRIFYAGEMFRHERPQKGRYRQFSQLGVEWVGEGAGGPSAEIQLLSMAHCYLSSLQIPYELHINSIGNTEDRTKYKGALRNYFSKNDSELSSASRSRLDGGNLLRILDSKDMGDRHLSQLAPKISEYLSTESINHFSKVKEGLAEICVPFIEDPTLVRGLDYYNDVVFEFQFKDPKLGASQNAILAGGRYDSLSSILGGQSMPAIGWAAGIDRLCLLTDSKLLPLKKRPICMVLAKEKGKCNWELEKAALRLFHSLQNSTKICILFAGDGTMSKQFARAKKHNAIGVITIGQNELDCSSVNLRKLDDHTEVSVPFLDLIPELESLYNSTQPNDKRIE